MKSNCSTSGLGGGEGSEANLRRLARGGEVVGGEVVQGEVPHPEPHPPQKCKSSQA